MAKTIMISNHLYEELKRMKRQESFTQFIHKILEKTRERKTIKNVFKFFGALEGDTEYPEIQKNLKKEWAAWSKKYV